MTTSIDYLEAAKIEELTSQLRNEGYDVTVNPGADDQGYDLVAEKNGSKVAVEVKFNARLRESAETIKTLRRRAIEQGFDEFRLVVVSAPHETDVHIEGLDRKLLDYFKESPPDALKNVPQSPGVAGVRDLEMDSISITADGTRVSGNGVISAVGRPASGFYVTTIMLSTLKWDFPFSFDIKLDKELRITDVHRIDVDTSSWDD